MSRYSKSRLLPILFITVIIIISIAALVSLARAVFFSGGSSTKKEVQVDTSQESLLSTTVDRRVRLTVRGPIVADESFRSYRIEVTPSSRVMAVYKSYLGEQIQQEALDNNIPAYEQFVYALDKANMVKGVQFEGDKNDTRGICATGRVYEFEVLNGDDSIKHLWTSTCKGSPGSLDASVDQLTNLFFRQIPDSQSILSKNGFGSSFSGGLSF